MRNLSTEYFSDNTLVRDLHDLVVGDFLGSGVGRQVFVYRPDPTCVLKIEAEGRSFQNVMEWEIWDRVRDCKPAAKWFAPCVSISTCGTMLIQKRARPAIAQEMPKRIPSFFTDCKLDNWGLLDGKPVAVDYGIHRLVEVGLTKRMQKVRWSEDTA